MLNYIGEECNREVLRGWICSHAAEIDCFDTESCDAESYDALYEKVICDDVLDDNTYETFVTSTTPAAMGRVVRADRRPGQAQHHLNRRGRIHRGAIPGQDGIEPLTERVNQLHVAWRGLRAGGTETHLGLGSNPSLSICWRSLI